MPLDVKAPALGGIGGRIKAVPKLVWILGGGVILAAVIFKGKSGGSATTGTPAGLSTTSGGGGGGTTDTGQSTLTGEDLTTFLADQAQSQADFQQSLIDIIGGIQPPTPVSPGTPIPPVTPPTTTPTGTTVTPPKVSTYKVSLTGRTNFLSTALKGLGTGSSGTYAATKITLKGKSYFRFKRAGRWTLIPASAKTIKVTPVTPTK